MDALLDVLDDLIRQGEELVPKGGSSIAYGPNVELQPQYMEWRYQALDAIKALGSRGQVILQELLDAEYGQFFYQKSASRVLGGLKAARALARSPLQTGSPSSTAEKKKRSQDVSAKAFVVHGHETAAREQVARFLEKLDIQPILLMEEPHKGRTLIEKLETNSDAQYAIVIFTPDDVGRSKDEEELKARARQNVVLELGYFVGGIGRENVCVLMMEGMEMPSDVHGVGYHPIDPQGAWKLLLAREMKAAGLPVDLNKVI